MSRKWRNSVRPGRISINTIIGLGATIAGGVAGAAIGGGALFGIGFSNVFGLTGTQIGGMLGMMAGSTLGNLLFPMARQETPWPELNEYPIQKSTNGPPLQKVLGTRKIAGNVTWEGDVNPYAIKHSAGGGKGGGGGGKGGEVEETRYRQSFLIDLGEGPAAVLKIWANNKQIYPDVAGAGTEPDVTIFKGIANQGIKDLTGEDYGEWPRNCCVFFNEYELGNQTTRPNFTFEVSTITDAFQNTYIAANNFVDVLDEDLASIEHQTLPAAGAMTLDINAATYEVVVGQNAAIVKRDAEGNLDADYYVPDAGWPANIDVVRGLRFTHDGSYLYAVIVTQDVTPRLILYKFDVNTGAEVWNYETTWTTFGLTLDSEDNAYFPVQRIAPYGPTDPSGAQKINSDGTLGTSYSDTPGNGFFFSRDIWIDEGQNILVAVGKDYDFPSVVWEQIACWNLATGAFLWSASIENNSMTRLVAVKTRMGSDDFIYACGDRMTNDGTIASVWKLDMDGDIVASYDTGYDTTHLWFDKNDQLIVKGSSTDDKLYILNTSLVLQSTVDYTEQGVYGSEGMQQPVPILTGQVKDMNFGEMCHKIVTDDQWGAGFDSSQINETTFNAIITYCGEQNFLGSVVLDTRKNWRDWLDFICAHFGGYWHEKPAGQLSLGAYRNEDPVGNPLTVAGRDFVIEKGENPPPPISVKDREYSETFNRVKVIWTDRDREYAIGGPFVADDETDQRISGQVREKIYDLSGICNATLAQRMTYQLLIEAMYRFKNYHFILTYKNMLHEVGDVKLISDGDQIVDQKVRLFKISEDKDGRGLDCVAIEDITSLYPAITFSGQASLRSDPTAIDLADGTVNFREAVDLDELYLCIAPGSAQANGWYIYRSYDDSTYDLIGRCGIDGITGGDANSVGTLQSSLAAHGTMTWSPDESALVNIGTVTDLHTDINEYQFWHDFRLAKIGDEIIAFRDAEETATPGVWRISWLRRGLFGTVAAAHTAGETFCTLNTDFLYRFKESEIGQTLYFKAVTFYGEDAQNVASVSGVTVTIQGYATRPAAGSLLRLTSDQNEGGSGHYSGSSFTLYWNLGSRVSGFNYGDWLNLPWNNYIADPELQAVRIKFEQEDGTPIGQREIAVGNSATIVKATDLGGFDTARIRIVPRRVLGSRLENSILVTSI